MLDNLFLSLTIVFMMPVVWGTWTANRAVRGSYRRVQAVTVCVICYSFFVLLDGSFGVVSIFHHRYGKAGLYTAVAVWWAYQAIKYFKDDDNWFNNQFKKLKRHLKNLRHKLSVSFLSHPAYGSA